MNNTPFPKEEDDNIKIDEIIEDRLFDNRWNFYGLVDDEMYQYNFEMRPYIYPDVESKGEWFDGMVRLSHTKLFHQFWKSCQNVTHVEASEDTGSIK